MTSNDITYYIHVEVTWVHCDLQNYSEGQRYQYNFTLIVEVADNYCYLPHKQSYIYLCDSPNEGKSYGQQRIITNLPRVLSLDWAKNNSRGGKDGKLIINFIFNKNGGYIVIASASGKGKWINTSFIWEYCWNTCSGQVQWPEINVWSRRKEKAETNKQVGPDNLGCFIYTVPMVFMNNFHFLCF